MTAARSFAALLRAAALFVMTLATTVPASGSAHTVFAMLSIDDAVVPGRCPVAGLLAVPAAWQAGDAAAVIIAPARDTLHHGLIAGLLSEMTAVLEIADEARCGAEMPLLAKAALTEAIGPGALVAIGYEAAGAQALRAGLDGFLAGIAIDGGTVRIAAGPPAPPEEQIGRRWPLLCAVLATNAPIDAATCRSAMAPAPSLLAGGLR